MGRFIGGIFSNESTLGRIMTAFGIMIGANILFAVFSLPVVTIGPGLAALHYVMLKMLHRDNSLNPFKTFWEGFRQNLKQGTVCWLMFLAIAAFLILDIRFCIYQGGVLVWFKYALYALGFLVCMLWVCLMPVMAAFEDTIPHLLRNALFFASKNPLRAVAAAVIWALPLAVTVLDERMRPLYGFCWVTCGFGILSAVTSGLFYRDIARYLPAGEEDGEKKEPGQEAYEKNERQIRREMKKLDR